MAAGENKKLTAELAELREKLNKAMRKKDYYVAAETCHAILEMDARAKQLNIMACLYHKDLGEIYVKLLEFERAREHLVIARDGLVEHRATKKLKFADEWLFDLRGIERLIEKIDRVHLKGRF